MGLLWAEDGHCFVKNAVAIEIADLVRWRGIIKP
jgi:hypothetical protein